MAGSGGAPADAGTTDTRVDRPDEGLPGLATVGNSAANPPTRAAFDAGISAGGQTARQVAQVDTSGHLIDPWTALKRANPTKW